MMRHLQAQTRKWSRKWLMLGANLCSAERIADTQCVKAGIEFDVDNHPRLTIMQHAVHQVFSQAVQFFTTATVWSIAYMWRLRRRSRASIGPRLSTCDMVSHVDSLGHC